LSWNKAEAVVPRHLVDLRDIPQNQVVSLLDDRQFLVRPGFSMGAQAVPTAQPKAKGKKIKGKG